MKICVIGGSNIDLVAEPYNALKINDSNPGSISKNAGGVGRNIAENLGRLGLKPSLITLLGKGEDGVFIKTVTEQAKVDVYPIYKDEQPTYLAILDETKDMHIAISSMDVMDTLTVEDFKPYEQHLTASDWLVIDTNLSPPILDYLFEFDKPIFVDAISTQKAKKLSPYLDRIHTLKLNQYEAHALTSSHDADKSINQLLQKGVKQVYITAGKDGVYYNQGKNIQHQTVKPIKAVNATGAGDAFCAGLLYGISNHKPPLYYAVAASSITLNSIDAVSKALTEETLLKKVEEQEND